MNKKVLQGFTLAEVLITLGIIGTVAAMTIPILIQEYQKKVWTTQLQKPIQFLNKDFKKCWRMMEFKNYLIQIFGQA